MVGDALKFGLGPLLVRLWRALKPSRHRQFVGLLVLMLISAFAEVVSLGAVLPFLGILTKPETVLNHPLVTEYAQSMGINTADQLIVPFTIAFVAAAIIAGTIRLLLLWVSTRLAFAIGADLSVEAYRRTLYQPYHVHVARNSSEVVSGIVSKVSGAVGVLYNLLTLASSATLIIIITVALFVIDPLVASVASLGFGVCYGAIAMGTRGRLHRNSLRIAHEQTQVVKALQEGLGGIRDVLLDGTQAAYCEVYRRADVPLRWAQGNILFIGGSPRFVMEALGMVMIAALAYGLSLKDAGLTAALPVLGALALGAQRLLPALQNGYNAWAGIIGSKALLRDTLDLLAQPVSPVMLAPAPAPMQFENSIRFEGVHFRYDNEHPWILTGLDLEIKKGIRIGFVGATGSGKSTTVDLLMGLLATTHGRILVDGEEISLANLRAWQQCIAHVPQSIFLADATLAENIAFGLRREDIDMARVKQAARQAQIADYIEDDEKGYEAFVGERGIRLSGGQRQRIGIARALYKRASVLVFDEATSALDSATENSVMQAIDGLDRDLTIVLIAHRLTTVQKCDEIIELEQGRIVAQGSYEALLSASKSFRKLALGG